MIFHLRRFATVLGENIRENKLLQHKKKDLLSSSPMPVVHFFFKGSKVDWEEQS